MTIDVTLRFEDEEHAQDFARFMCEKEHWNVGHILMVPADSYPDAGYDIDAKVINIQKVPPSYCTCPSTKGLPFTRGKVFGWYVCVMCNKVSRKVFQNFGLLSLGINLIPVGLRLSSRGSECNEVSPKEWNFLL